MHEKPDVVKTHLRNMVIMPEMIGSMVGVYNGKTFTAVEIKVRRIIAQTPDLKVHFLTLTFAGRDDRNLPCRVLDDLQAD